MQLFMLFIDSNTLYISGVTHPSPGVQELCVQLMVQSCTTYHYIEQHDCTISCIHSSWTPDDGRVTPEIYSVLLSIKSIVASRWLLIWSSEELTFYATTRYWIYRNFIIVVCFLLGNSPASEFYMSTFFISTRLWRWNRQSVPKCWHIKFTRRGITQRKAHNFQNAARTWKQEKFVIAWNTEWRSNWLIERLSNIGWFKSLIIEHKID